MPCLDPFKIPFGINAPQDIQDSQDSQDYQGKTENLTGILNGDQTIDLAAMLAMPLHEYLKQVHEFAEQHTEEQLTDRMWCSPLFHFARLSKAHPAITDLPSHEAMQQVEDAMLAWDDLPKDRDPWEYFFDSEDADAARLDFMTSWSAVRYVPFQDVLRNALRLGNERPLTPPHKRGNLYARFVSLAGWLQMLMDGSAIYLPTRKLDTLLRCDHTTVSRLRKLAIEDGLLTVVKHHTFRTTGKGEATEFRFAVERFDTLRRDR